MVGAGLEGRLPFASRECDVSLSSRYLYNNLGLLRAERNLLPEGAHEEKPLTPVPPDEKVVSRDAIHALCESLYAAYKKQKDLPQFEKPQYMKPKSSNKKERKKS